MIGKMIEKLFAGKEVHLMVSNFCGETIELSQFSIENKYVLHVFVVKYHDDCGILETENFKGQKIYLNADHIDCFFAPDVNIVQSIATMIPSGKKLKVDFK